MYELYIWLQNDCTMQLNDFRTEVGTVLQLSKPTLKHANWATDKLHTASHVFKSCVHAVLEADMSMSNNAIWCECLDGSSPNGNRTIVWSCSMAARPLWILFLKLPAHCRNISACTTAYVWVLPKASEHLHVSFTWFQNLCECIEPFRVKWMSMCKHFPMVTERLWTMRWSSIASRQLQTVFLKLQRPCWIMSVGLNVYSMALRLTTDTLYEDKCRSNSDCITVSMWALLKASEHI